MRQSVRSGAIFSEGVIHVLYKHMQNSASYLW